MNMATYGSHMETILSGEMTFDIVKHQILATPIEIFCLMPIFVQKWIHRSSNSKTILHIQLPSQCQILLKHWWLLEAVVTKVWKVCRFTDFMEFFASQHKISRIKVQARRFMLPAYSSEPTPEKYRHGKQVSGRWGGSNHTESNVPFGLLQSQRFTFLLRAFLYPFPCQEYHKIFFASLHILHRSNPLRFPKMIASRHGSIDAMAFRGARWALHVGRRRCFFFVVLKKSLKNIRKQHKTATTTQQFQRCLHPLTGGTSTASLEHGPRPRAKQQKQASEAEVAGKKFATFLLPEFCLSLHSAFFCLWECQLWEFHLDIDRTGLLDLQIDFYLILILSWNQKDANFLVHILFLRMAVAHWFQHSFWTRDGAPQSKTGWYLYVWVEKSSSLQ